MKNYLRNKIIYVMGVSGSGKSSIGRLLASHYSLPFIDADDHHPQSNIEKMSQGIPLTDRDREPWLEILSRIAMDHINEGCVIACSALKVQYRTQLNHGMESDVKWVYLKGDYDTIYNRMKNRNGHFMDATMLKSQFETLEEPDDSIIVDIKESPENIIKSIIIQLV